MTRYIPKDLNLNPIMCSYFLYGCVDCDIKINLTCTHVSRILIM